MEQLKMFIVSGFDEPLEVDVIKKNGKIFVYSYVGETEFIEPSDDIVFFSTKEKANEYHYKMISNLDTKRIKEYIEYLYNENRVEEILPEFIFEGFKKGHNACMLLSYKDICTLKVALKGVLNIESVSFRITDVDYINYGKDWLSIILKNGQKIIPQTEFEFFIVESIFGSNYSSRYNPTILKPL